MKRNSLLAAVGVATFVAMSAASAEGYVRLSFTGSVVQEACSSGLASFDAQSGDRSCGSGSSRAFYTENSASAQHATGVAMLDYFVDRPDGGRKVLVTRQYR